jgi:threonine/homoserine/homoserine lactone efflux protein
MLTDQFLPFLLTALLIELTPGPNMAWLALTGASAGRKAALAATAGIAVGLSVLSLLAALGIAELAQTSPALFSSLRYAGAAYLFWLAWEAWRGEREVSPGVATGNDARQWFRHGLLINLLNPKAALFFIAILPGYVVTDLPATPQILLLSIAYVAVATAIHGTISVLAGRAHGWFGEGWNAERLRKTCAVLMAAVAAWFLITTMA